MKLLEMSEPAEGGLRLLVTRAVTDASERITTLDDLRDVSEAFLASSAREVQPVRAIDGIATPAVPGPVSVEATARVRAYIEARL